jgi:pimeloyl-ACP methyl ester carboxylesterase
VLVGNDIGGAIAQLCAIRAPEAISALVLINSATLTREPGHLRTGWLCLSARRKLVQLLRRDSRAPA